MTQMFEIKVTVTGEVRDAEGNLLNSEPVEMTQLVTQDQLQELIEQGDPQ